MWLGLVRRGETLPQGESPSTTGGITGRQAPPNARIEWAEKRKGDDLSVAARSTSKLVGGCYEVTGSAVRLRPWPA